MQRRVGRRHHQGQGDYDDGLWISERRRIVEAEIKVVLLGQRERRDVLILRGMRGAKNSNHVHNCAHVWAVVSGARGRSRADLNQQVAGGARTKGRDHGLAVSVIEIQLIGVLSKAGSLLRAGLVKALLVEADLEAARQKSAARLHLFGIRGSLVNRIEIFLQTLAIEAGLFKI